MEIEMVRDSYNLGYPAGDANARRVVLAAQCGMSDTNPEIARPIFLAQ